MSAESPPIYYFTNINFNSSFYDPANTGLTQTQANALYLRKTTPDTASAIETFAGGVLTDTINSITAGSNMAIASNHTAEDLFLGQNITSGDIYIGVDASATTGRSGTIHIGDGNNITGGTIHINNGTTNASNTNINNGATTTGTVNIMTGNTSSGTINLATGSGSAKVNIGSGTTTGIVNIGNTTNAVNINSSALSLGSSTKSLTVNAPITVAYLQTEITSNTQIGFKVNGTSSSVTSMLASTITTFWSAPLVSGVWYLLGNAKYVSPGAFGRLYITATIDTADDAAAVALPGIANMVLQVSRIITVAPGTTPTYYLTGSVGNATTVNNIVFRVYRLA
jgi:hypothetical protein